MTAVDRQSRLTSMLDERSVPPAQLLAACVATMKARSGCLSRREGKVSPTAAGATVPVAGGRADPVAEGAPPQSLDDVDTGPT